jgi:hypothetical protein
MKRSGNQGSRDASLTFFAIELTGCLGPEAQRLCTQLADLTGEGPEGRKRVNELISIRFFLRGHITTSKKA